MAHSFTGRLFGARLQKSLAIHKSAQGYKSDMWISKHFADKFGFSPRPNESAIDIHMVGFFNLEQMAEQDYICNKSREFRAPLQLLFATSGRLISDRNHALAKELAAASRECRYSSPYWDGAVALAKNFGVSIPASAQHTCGYFNVEQTSNPSIFTPESCVPFAPKLVGSVHSDVVPALRRHVLGLPSESRKRLINAWGTESGFAILRVPLKHDACGVQVIDEYGCASHWFNVADSTDPHSAYCKMASSLP